MVGGHRSSTAQTGATLATMLRHEDGAFGTERRLTACAQGERNVVCRAEGVLRGFLIGQSVFVLVVRDEAACDGSADDDADDDERSSTVVVFGDGSEVSGLVWREWVTGDDFDSAYKVGFRDRHPACQDLVLSLDSYGRGNGPEGNIGIGVEDGELKGWAGDGIDAAAIAADVSNGSDAFKLEDEIGLIW
jgi:hypothetical protein